MGAASGHAGGDCRLPGWKPGTGKVFTAVVQQAGDEKERQSFEQELTKIIETDETLARVFPK